MSQHSSDHSSFDKNLRSLLDAVSMFEREAGLAMDRFGLDREAVNRVLNLVGSVSAEMVRPVASALGIADAATVESLAGDVRALLQSEARQRREQEAAAARFEDILAALAALGATTAGLADLQTRVQDRLDALAARSQEAVATGEQRQGLADDVARLVTKVGELEATLASELGLSPSGAEIASTPDGPVGVQSTTPRRSVSRTVRATSGSHKILEGLPTLEPKIRPV